MLRSLLLNALVFATALLPAQSPLLEILADEVCKCMTDAPELVFPRIQAARCVEDVANNHPRQIRAELNLSAVLAADREELSELLIDRLTRNCEVLHTLTPGKKEVELFYSDRSLLNRPAPSASPKYPSPDPPTAQVREGKEASEVTGRISSVNASQLTVISDAGNQLTLSITGRQQRKWDLQAGMEVTLTYEYDWRTGSDRASPALISVE